MIRHTHIPHIARSRRPGLLEMYVWITHITMLNTLPENAVPDGSCGGAQVGLKPGGGERSDPSPPLVRTTGHSQVTG